MNKLGKNRFKILIYTGMVFSALTLTACGRGGVESDFDYHTAGNVPDQSENVTENLTQQPEGETRVISAEVSAAYDLLSVQAEVEVPAGVNLDAVPLGTAMVHLLDMEQICEDITCLGAGVREQIDDEHENGNEDMDSYPSRIIYYEDGRTLVIDPFYLHYYTPLALFIGGKVLWEEEGLAEYNPDLYRDRELNFAESADVYRKVRNRLDEWGIVLGERYELLGLDHETMAEQEYVTNDRGEYDASLKKESWTEEDDCYYFRCAQEFHGIPIYYYGYGVLRGYHNIGSAFKIKYGRNGFVEIEVNRPYDVQDSGKTVRIISPEEAVDCLIRKYSNIIMTDSVAVDKLSLQMLPERSAPGRYDLIPVWVFEGKEHWVFDDGSEGEVSDKYMFNAATGKEIIL